MYFRRCTLKAFGHFRDRDIEGLSEKVVVVLGPNEAGKSTFFAFLQTVLYGIYPTSAEKHKYAPRDHRSLEGSAEIVLSTGDMLDVSRRLSHVPEGHLFNGKSIDLKNKSVPAADFISRRVFDAIYALDLHDMTGLQGRAWADVQDRLLGGMNLDFLRSARVVVEDVEGEATDLWRADKRGRPAERQVREEREALGARLDAAQIREMELRALSLEIDEGEKRIAKLKRSVPELLSEVRRLDRLGPIAMRWQKLTSLQSEADDIDTYRLIPENPRAILDEWYRRDADYSEQLKAIGTQIDKSESDQLAVSDEDITISRYGVEIRAWSKRVGAHDVNLAGLRTTGLELCSLRSRMQRLLVDIEDPYRPGSIINALGVFDLDDLAQHVTARDLAAEKLRTTRTRDKELADAFGRRKPRIPTLVLAAGAVVGAAGFLQELAPVWMAGAGITAAGLLWLVFELYRSRVLSVQREDLQLVSVEAAHASATDIANKDCAALGIAADLTEDANAELVSNLKLINAMIGQRQKLVNQARALIGMLDANKRDANQLAQLCGVRDDLDVSSTVALLQQRLDEGAERVRLGEQGHQRLFRLNRDHDRILADKQALLDQIVQIEAALEELGAGNLQDGVNILEKRRSAMMKAEYEAATLDKDHPGWRDLQSELEALTEDDIAQFSESSRVKRESELEEKRVQLNYEQVRSARKKQELKQQGRHESPDEVESQIAVADEQLQLLRRKRDRLVLLANIIRRADQQFRYKHQPDVIRKASEYLAKITGGRYSKLLLEDDAQQLKVFERGNKFPADVDDSLSQGTRDQIYLSIRFALMDHLDANQERLPAFLDEVFVNWDKERRMLGYEILKDLSERRQVFVFTCHPWLAEELQTVLTAQQIVM